MDWTRKGGEVALAALDALLAAGSLLQLIERFVVLPRAGVEAAALRDVRPHEDLTLAALQAHEARARQPAPCPIVFRLCWRSSALRLWQAE